MKSIDLKVGDVITILKRPIHWSSRLCHNSPLNLSFPLTGVVEELKTVGGYTAAKISGYGYDVTTKSFHYKKNIDYEIY